MASGYWIFIHSLQVWAIIQSPFYNAIYIHSTGFAHNTFDGFHCQYEYINGANYSSHSCHVLVDLYLHAIISKSVVHRWWSGESSHCWYCRMMSRLNGFNAYHHHHHHHQINSKTYMLFLSLNQSIWLLIDFKLYYYKHKQSFEKKLLYWKNNNTPSRNNASISI